MADALDMSELPEKWRLALEKHGFDGRALRAMVGDLYGASETPVYPDRRNVFRAFHLTPIDRVRVVVLGQDPYPKRGQAHGLAFSAPTIDPIPRSLNTIYTNLVNDSALDFKRPATGDLTPWAHEGVLLLNTALTVAEGRPGSHARCWKGFTDLVLRAVDAQCERVAFLLWGGPAIRKAKAVPISEPKHRVIRSAHPAAWGKSNEPHFRETHPFSEANEFLKADRPSWNL